MCFYKYLPKLVSQVSREQEKERLTDLCTNISETFMDPDYAVPGGSHGRKTSRI